MKLLYTLSIISALVFAFANRADACSIEPLDAQAALAKSSDRMEASALAAMGIESINVLDAVWSEVKGDYIWSNPMCPEGHWVEGKLTVSVASQDPLTKGCTAVALVKRSIAEAVWSINTRELINPAINNFNVEIIQEMTCLE